MQRVFVEAINECLDMIGKMKLPDTMETDSSYDSQYDSDSHTTGVQSILRDTQRLVNLVYDLLSLLDPSAEMSKLVEKIDTLFILLLKTDHVIAQGFTVKFDSGKVYSCLLGRSTPFLINRFHDVEEYLRVNQSTLRPVGEQGGPTKMVAEAQGSPSTLEEWRDMFYEAMYDHKHFLEGMMVSMWLSCDCHVIEVTLRMHLSHTM